MTTDPQETPRMDGADLWREEVFTDRKVGTIRRLTPVKPDGSSDMGRKALFVGEASLYTPAGTLPLNFEIPAETLDQAVTAYGEAVQEAFAQALEELEEMRRKAASSIVIPKGGAASLSGLSVAGMPPGKIQLP